MTPNISFEFFPPETLDASFRLWDAVQLLSPFGPNFVSVTYGAGGATRDKTHDALTTLGTHYGLNVAGHLTCVNATRAETMAVADRYAQAGVTEIVALRGDPPKGTGPFQPHPDGFESSVELITALAETGKFQIRVAAYPERHPEAQSDQSDLEMLKRKFDAGATSAITQYFFDVDRFLRFRDAAAKLGIDGKIIPGILPIENWQNVKRFSKRCGTHLPDWLDHAFRNAEAEGMEDLLATSIATEIITELSQEGVEDFHFYTLNRPTLTRRILQAIGLSPGDQLQAVA